LYIPQALILNIDTNDTYSYPPIYVGVFCAQAVDAEAKSSQDSSSSRAAEDSKSSASTPLESEATKDKRQVSSKETPLYPNHRSSEASPSGGDDPEDGQETIYGSKPNQFIIRPIAPHQHQQHESHQEPQLRNFAAANSRPHAAQLLEQSQEVSWNNPYIIMILLYIIYLYHAKTK